MRIGFVSIYSWRPHVEHNFYLSTLLEEAGHEIFFLTCDGCLPTCYTRELKKESFSWKECLKCRIGGIRSFTKSNITSIKSIKNSTFSNLNRERVVEWCQSSAATLLRYETKEEFNNETSHLLVNKLANAAEIAYNASKQWIDDNKLDTLFLFNARMDTTRAIFEAAKDKGIRCIVVERTWFGDGIKLHPDENCLSLQSSDQLVRKWREYPLTREQALLGASYISLRMLRQNHNEFRVYNKNASNESWSTTGKRRILLIPSTSNEMWGHPDWISSWEEPTDAYDALIKHLDLDSNELILRCHPNWGEKIGLTTGISSENYYTKWASDRKILVIPSQNKTSTQFLLEQCDAVIVHNGSAALEAGLLGKQVIATAPSLYQEGKFCTTAFNQNQISNIKLNINLSSDEKTKESEKIIRYTIRFCYTMANRIAQYVPYIRSINPTKYVYNNGADVNKIIELITTGKLDADNKIYANDTSEENEVIAILRKKEWHHFSEYYHSHRDMENAATLNRRPIFNYINKIRDKLPAGYILK